MPLVVFLGKGIISNIKTQGKSHVTQKQNFGAGAAFLSPLPTVFCGGVQVGMPRVPWQELFIIPASVKGEEGDFPRAALKGSVYVRVYVWR